MADAAIVDENATEKAFRAKLGVWLVVWSSGALVLLALTIVIAAAITGTAETVLSSANLLLTALLPLFGTWVGTVLAFYYTRANYEAASRGTMDVVKSISARLSATKVSERMMPFISIVYITVGSVAEIGEVTIQEVQDKFDLVGANGRKISRLIFIDKTRAAVAVLHKSIWVEMLNEAYKAGTVDPKAMISTMIDKPSTSTAGTTFRNFIIQTIGFIGGDQSMADAKAKMEAIPQCQDLFVTATGQSNEAMTGWLSNIDIAMFSRA